MSLLGKIAKIGLAPVTGGGSLFAGEDTLARIPVVGALTGSKTKAQKRLVEEQKRMAADMRKRSAMNERARLNAMQQRLGAVAPLNQAMAQMYGPDAAFSPEQFAQMGANPFGPYKGVWGQGTDEERRNQVLDKQAEERRQAALRAMPAPGPGPAPLERRRPQAARRF